eukprot:CAMPEP_0195627766 /NCGR_PEP_ID=MMETSP0815-20121206/19101_1 /TAXON_ID=97485 /ORGANISM="Prymnesium parvum, Strain Texoma1" /LENGTH=128 /DNA_ID=CAMNT_0040769011 /DNA_START=202 /DNA_END=589 /DNA_ORIENTATION=-
MAAATAWFPGVLFGLDAFIGLKNINSLDDHQVDERLHLPLRLRLLCGGAPLRRPRGGPRAAHAEPIGPTSARDATPQCAHQHRVAHPIHETVQEAVEGADRIARIIQPGHPIDVLLPDHDEQVTQHAG